MKDFFKNILYEPLAIHIDKMNEISKIISAREESSNIGFLAFILLFSEIIEDYRKLEHKSKEIHISKEFVDEVEMSEIKISLCVSVLVNFFYPIIEQLEKIADDGIILQKDLY